MRHSTHTRQPLAEAHPIIKAKLLALVTHVEGNRAGMLATMDAITAEIAAGDASLEQGLARLDVLLASLVATIEDCKEEAKAAWAPSRAALVEQRADTDDHVRVLDNATAYTKGLVAMVGAAELARASPMVAGQLTAIHDGTQRMPPCVQAPAGGSMVQIDEAAVTKAVKERVVLAKGTIKAWKRDLVGRATLEAAIVPPKRARYVYAIGGYGACTQQVERFDLQTRQWEVRTPLSTTGGCDLAAVVLKDHLYAMGGSSATAMDRYKETANAWEACAAIPRAKSPAAAAVVGGKAYVLCNQQLDCYDHDSGAWETLPDAPSAHSYGALVAHDQFMFILGHWSPVSAIVDRYDTVRRVWEHRAPMPAPRGRCGAALLRGRIYVVGGTTNGSDRLTDVLRYDPTTDVWDGTGCAPLRTGRYALAVCAVNYERILAIGGWAGSSLDRVEEYNPDSNSWSTCPSMPTARYDLAGVCM